MFGCFRQLTLAGAVLTGLALGVSASPGYLPAVGPAALRFRAAVEPATNLVRMPLPSPETPPAIQLPPPVAAVPAAPVVAPAPVVLAASSAPTNSAPEPDPGSATSGPQVSAQMLLKFFNRSTNGAAAGIIAPMDFAPPGTAKAPSSTATYSTDPK